VRAAADTSPAGWYTATGGGYQYTGVFCSNAYTCWFAGGDYGPAGVIWATGNGGESWIRELDAAGSFFENMDCPRLSPFSGWCVAVGGAVSGKTVRGSVYYRAGAAHWYPWTLPAGTGEIGWVKCAPEVKISGANFTGYCLATTANGSGLKSTDGGRTWSAAPILTTTPKSGKIWNQGMAIPSTSVIYVTGYTGCDAVGDNCPHSVIQRSIDGGATWHLLSTPANLSPMDNISCSSTSQCLAVGTSIVGAAAYMTFDGGAQWQPMSLPFGMGFANGVYCAGRQCDIVGGSGSDNNLTGSVVYVTRDAGRTWTVQSAGGPSGLVDIFCPTSVVCWAGGFSQVGGAITYTFNGGVAPAGYRFVASDGGVFNYGDADFYGSTGNVKLNEPIVGTAYNPFSRGYWLVASDGGVFTFNTGFYGSTGKVNLVEPIVGMASTFDGFGYYLVASDGGIFTFGDATFYGSTGAHHLNKPIVGMALDRLTGGYWLVASDGGVFSFNAPFEGSTGHVNLTEPIVGVAADPATGGYWLVASDGGVFSFNAPFYGSTGNVRLNKPIVGIQSTPDGHGYWLVASDGGIFSFGDAGFYGSTGNVNLVKPIVGMAANT
jgi:hypothetical protein